MADDVQLMLFYYNYMAKLYPDRYKPFVSSHRVGSKQWQRELRQWQRNNKLTARKRNATKTVSPGVRQAILDRDGHKCFFCGATTNLHVHHMTPRSKGGTDDPENLLVVCEKCHTWLHEGDPVHALMVKRLTEREVS